MGGRSGVVEVGWLVLCGSRARAWSAARRGAGLHAAGRWPAAARAHSAAAPFPFADASTRRSSATDVLLWSKSPFAAWMDRLYKADPGHDLCRERDTPDEFMAMLARKGNEWEHEVKTHLVERGGRSIIDLTPAAQLARRDPKAAYGATMAALQDKGATVLYQVPLCGDTVAGVADFVVRLVDGSFAIWDAKLSRRARPRDVLQLCCYAELLAGYVGAPVTAGGLILRSRDNVDGAPPPLTQSDARFGRRSAREPAVTGISLAHYAASWRSTRRGFEEFLERADPTRASTMPLPRGDVPADSHGKWNKLAARLLEEARARADDMHAGVAGITSRQGSRLKRAGVSTTAALAGLKANAKIKGMRDDTFQQLRAQAILVLATKRARARDATTAPKWAALPLSPTSLKPAPRRMLPPRTPEDTFFDLEGDPFSKREYLWGVVSYGADGEALEFARDWAHDAISERAAFSKWIDEFSARWERSRAHVYHYGAYEVTAMRRVAAEAGDSAREALVNALEAQGVFVDLYKVVRRNVMVGEPRYSIKNVEKLYRPQRSGDVQSAASSVIEYDNWLESRDEAILDSIELYNKDDCVSTAELAQWLREVFREDLVPLNDCGQSDASTASDSDLDAAPDAAVAARQSLLQRLVGGDVMYREDAEARRLRTLAGWTGKPGLDGVRAAEARREQMPAYRQKREWLAAPPHELSDDERCVGAAWLVGKPAVEAPKKGGRAPAAVYDYAFAALQLTRVEVGKTVIVRDDEAGPADGPQATATVVSVDADAGTVRLRSSKAMPTQASLIPDDFVNAQPLPAAIVAALGEAFGESAARERALAHFARRALPRLSGMDHGAEVVDTFSKPGGDVVDAAISAISAMDATTLAIQGPPGTGKTYLAARAICDLVRQGRTVGVVAPSHATISHTIITAALAYHPGKMHAFKLGKRVTLNGDDDDDARLTAAGVELRQRMEPKLVKELRELKASNVGVVVGATAWGFANSATREPGAPKLFDYLFVDEAGQLPAAARETPPNLVAVSGCATNLVLFGDQMQLPAPARGAHPADAGLSCLEYLLDGDQTVAPELGVFLKDTRRLHPKLCAAISELVYDGRLEAHPEAADRLVVGALSTDLVQAEAGLVFVDVRESADLDRVATVNQREAYYVATIAKQLVDSRQCVTMAGHATAASRPLQQSDVLVVAPYNAHVRAIQAELERVGLDGVRVGTVDRFQGREAPVVIASLCVAAGAPPGDDGSGGGDASPRALSFVLDIRRLNVALSRAQSLAVVVAAPDLASAAAPTIERMRELAMLARRRPAPTDRGPRASALPHRRARLRELSVEVVDVDDDGAAAVAARQGGGAAVS
ncbi:P-loop containing nucleoside triphosphate hydrolase protein [Pelagophyceae sp. CCMP2097]|nr:P-loop containing nucleoside triphosphate hydrolase protein [Pelagophyceae sp. CCMP2097]